MDATNQILQITNQVLQQTPPPGHAPITMAWWEIVKPIGLIIISILASIYFNQRIERRKNRMRFFKMEKVDFTNIHTGPAEHRGKPYKSVLCATYRLKNSTELDYRELVLRMGFRDGEIIHVQPRSDIIGEDHFKVDKSGMTQITVTIPIFNRGDVVDLRLEIANSHEIDLSYKYVSSHTGIQITQPPLRASPGPTTSPRPSFASQGGAQVEKIGALQRFRAWLSNIIDPGTGT